MRLAWMATRFPPTPVACRERERETGQEAPGGSRPRVAEQDRPGPEPNQVRSSARGAEGKTLPMMSCNSQRQNTSRELCGRQCVSVSVWVWPFGNSCRTVRVNPHKHREHSEEFPLDACALLNLTWVSERDKHNLPPTSFHHYYSFI